MRRGVFLGGRDADEAEFRVFEVRVEGDVRASEAEGRAAQLLFWGQNSMDRRSPQMASSKALVKLMMEVWYQGILLRHSRKKLRVMAKG